MPKVSIELIIFSLRLYTGKNEGKMHTNHVNVNKKVLAYKEMLQINIA